MRSDASRIELVRAGRASRLVRSTDILFRRWRERAAARLGLEVNRLLQAYDECLVALDADVDTGIDA